MCFISPTIISGPVSNTVHNVVGGGHVWDERTVHSCSLELPGLQMELALAVAKAATAPIIVILVNGGPLAIRQLKEHTKVGTCCVATRGVVCACRCVDVCV